MMSQMSNDTWRGMLRIKYDLEDRCGVLEVVPGPQRAEDWEKGADLLLLLDGEAARQGRDWVLFVLTSSGSERPNANFRKRLAELRSIYKCKQRLMVIVSDSILFRGALNAVNLLSPKSDGENFIVSSIKEGIEKAERWRGAPISILRGLEFTPATPP
jgi:hypothetical protein